MRRSELLIILGCVWTIYTAFSISAPQVTGPTATGLLTLGIILSGLLWLSCGLSGGRSLIITANITQIGISCIWLTWVKATSAIGALAPYDSLIILSLSVGVILANMGASSIELEPSPLSDITPATHYSLETTSSAYESGGFHNPILSACESGGFRTL